jgi:hypothetical protein
MMFDMDPSVANLFYKKTCRTGKEMTKKAGIDLLCPGAQIDDQAFTPCGYSMNAILHDAYFTMHITPQQECSYASFETNTCLDKFVVLIMLLFLFDQYFLKVFTAGAQCAESISSQAICFDHVWRSVGDGQSSFFSY